jgi:adenine-specific DNA-methyltransferase
MAQGMDAEAIGRLAERYKALTPQERRRYNEAQTRKDFIDPLFASLGWDVRGVERSEVDVETHVSGGRADYAFKVDGVVRFYLEAKKLEEDLYNPDYAKQVMTYAYNKGVPWAVLCNFARLQVFNAEWETDDLNRARFLDVTWEDYTRADSPLVLLSRQAFLANELDKRAQAYGGMRPRQAVEKSLYAQMRHWRERLFNEIARMRPDLTFEQVDEVIERLLNRLIFIRNCEDRKVEAAELRAALHQWQRPGRRAGLTEAVRAIFANFDATFDSDLFAFHLVDQLLASGTQLEETLGDIVAGLYAPPRSLAAYDFAVIDADVLGQVYEQYLGHVARVVKEEADKRERQLALGMEVPRIELEAKRQRRKERGIYYTPKWVVDYIVRQTVGRYLEEHTYNDVLNVKILDPACGSGSFLIRAFDLLLEYHAKVKGKAVAELDQYERLRILTANIFGVDLDKLAVDIARLNLLLRAVARRELLPSLKRNVVQGNSLISGSEEELRPYFGDTWEEKHPFDWQREFPAIMGQGGFDIIIGNPPYVKEYVNRQPFDDVRGSRLAEYYQGKADIWYIFACLAIDLLKPGGLHSFIATNNWITASGASLLREKVLSETRLQEFVDFGDCKVFESVGIQTMIYVLEKTGTPHEGEVRYSGITRPNTPVSDVIRFLFDGKGGDFAVSFDGVIETGREGQTFTFVDHRDARLLSRIESTGRYRLKPEDVGTGIDVHQDFVTARHLPHLPDSTIEPGVGIFVLSDNEKRSLGLTERERKLVKPYYTSEELGRYYGNPNNSSWLIYTDRAAVARIDEYPCIKAHLDRFAPVMTSDNRPYGLHRARDEDFFLGEKIVSLRKTDRPHFTYTDFPCYVSQTFFVVKPTDVNLKYLVAILNSSVCRFWLDRKGKKQGDALQVDKAPLLQIPIRLADVTVSDERELRDRVVALVQRMLALHERLATKGGVQDEERGGIVREIERTDREIDGLVYDLYGLTREERRLVEEGMGR